jgi:hypothetical protein
MKAIVSGISLGPGPSSSHRITLKFPDTDGAWNLIKVIEGELGIELLALGDEIDVQFSVETKRRGK